VVDEFYPFQKEVNLEIWIHEKEKVLSSSEIPSFAPLETLRCFFVEPPVEPLPHSYVILVFVKLLRRGKQA